MAHRPLSQHQRDSLSRQIQAACWAIPGFESLIDTLHNSAQFDPDMRLMAWEGLGTLRIHLPRPQDRPWLLLVWTMPQHRLQLAVDVDTHEASLYGEDPPNMAALNTLLACLEGIAPQPKRAPDPVPAPTPRLRLVVNNG